MCQQHQQDLLIIKSLALDLMLTLILTEEIISENE